MVQYFFQRNLDFRILKCIILNLYTFQQSAYADLIWGSSAITVSKRLQGETKWLELNCKYKVYDKTHSLTVVIETR